MDTLEYILKKFNLKNYDPKKMPIEIPNYGRNNLAELFYELKFKVGVEIGVERALYSKILFDANPNLHLYCIDPWLAYKEYTDHIRQSKIDGFYEIAKQNLDPYNHTIIKKFSMDAVKDFSDNSLDFVYIDGNHRYENVVEDIVYWSKKVRPGGIISGHDFIRYNHQRNNHVIEAVTGYVLSYLISPWFVLGSKRKKEGEIRDNCRSFMWVKKE
jgi:hypothetical protein